MANKTAEIVKQTIRDRKTAKLLLDPAECDELSADDAAMVKQTVSEMVEVSGWAPFHKPANKQAHLGGDMSSIVPWRYYVLEKSACIKLIDFMNEQATADPESKWARAAKSKIPKLLAACSAMVQVTWLPDPAENGGQPELTINNMEHIAAASSAVQNLLLVAQAYGWHNYWSSGGVLKTDEAFDYLGIPQNQMLLGSIFLAHPDQPFETNRPGSWRDSRGNPSDWSVWLA